MQASALQLILQAGVFVKLILLILAGFSISSWTIIVYKYLDLTTAANESATFLRVFGSSNDPREWLKTANGLPRSPLANLFKAAHGTPARNRKSDGGKWLKRHETIELEKLRSYLTFLATTGSTTPFIGLLGTVWGIMDAFRGIGAVGSASLAVVSPAIAEALITTAAGLAAAIPAVMAYNVYLSWVRRMSVEVEDFSEQLRAQVAAGDL